MKQVLLALSVALAGPVAGASIDGTWKVDLSSAKLSDHHQIYSLVNGTYHCTSCSPAYSIPADGKFHAVRDQPGVDARAIRVVGARQVAFEDRKIGRLTGSSTLTVAPDSKTAEIAWKNIGANGKVVTGEGTLARVSPGPKGSHPISGVWRNAKVEKVDDAGLTITMHEAAGVLSVSYPTGESFSAKIGGPAVPIRGDLAGTMISVRRPGPTSLVETETVGGKVMTVTTMTGVNTTTMAVVSEDRRRGGITRYTIRK